jgi:hypothetical protein
MNREVKLYIMRPGWFNDTDKLLKAPEMPTYPLIALDSDA